MEMINDFFEKVRNLVQWEDEHITRIFLGFLTVVFLIVTFLPVKVILTLALFYKFAKGYTWQKCRTVHNREVCRIELCNFLKEKGFAPIDLDQKWEAICALHKDSDFHKKQFF